MQKVLITGGSGFIARYFIEKLSHISLVNLDICEPEFNSKATFIKGDVRNGNDVEKAIEGCDTLIHLAAMHHDFGIEEHEYFDVNVNGAKTLIAAAVRNNIKQIIFFSSVAVYGNQGYDAPTNEKSTPMPNSPYGKSKLEAEKLFQEWVRGSSNRKLVIVRSTVVFGAYNLANVLNLIKAIDSGFYFHIGSGNNIKSLAYVENIVDATLFALAHVDEASVLFNYVDEPQLSSREIATMQAGMLGRKIRIKIPYWFAIAMTKPFDLMIMLTGKNLAISSKRVKKLCTQTWHSADKIKDLGFVPKHSIEYGMQQMIDWYKKLKIEN
jgi:nucleoside-diphosphate-sugar epimerase